MKLLIMCRLPGNLLRSVIFLFLETTVLCEHSDVKYFFLSNQKTSQFLIENFVENQLGCSSLLILIDPFSTKLRHIVYENVQDEPTFTAIPQKTPSLKQCGCQQTFHSTYQSSPMCGATLNRHLRIFFS